MELLFRSQSGHISDLPNFLTSLEHSYIMRKLTLVSLFHGIYDIYNSPITSIQLEYKIHSTLSEINFFETPLKLLEAL